ncbi:unnamed protein product [Echinostoma caproni]|uniref:PHD-type domain-containing protein n=1 Tax=Echinostoma caproni TaxID=27848 RepID=A0A183AL46_9TREM|nr:unnamed protein product [Echinostoma caproni]
MSDRNSNLAQRLDATALHTQQALHSNHSLETCDPNRSNELPFASHDHSLHYRRSTECFPDPRTQSHDSVDPPPQPPVPPTSSARAVGHFPQHSDLASFHHHRHPHPHYLHGSIVSDGTTGVVPVVNYDVHMSVPPRGRPPTCCTSVDRLQPAQLQSQPQLQLQQQQQQQQYYSKMNCPPFEQNMYRSTNYPRPLGPMAPSVQSGVEPSGIPPQSMNAYTTPTQQNVEHRHSFVPCDPNALIESGTTGSVLSSEQAVDVEMKSVTHGTPFSSNRTGAYPSYSDAPNSISSSQNPHPSSNVRYAWSSGYSAPTYTNYHQTQQQQAMMHQTQQSYKVYYNGPSYDQMPPASNGMVYPIDPYGSHQGYPRQMSTAACDQHMYVQQQQQSHTQPQLMHSPTVTSSYVQFGQPVTAPSMDSFSSIDYPHPGQRVQTLSHPNLRSSGAAPLQTNGSAASRHPVPQSHLPVAPYASMDRRVPDIGSTEVYPNTASGDVNPIWPSADTCSSSSSAYMSESASVALPTSQVIRTGFKGHMGSLQSNVSGLHPTDPTHCLPANSAAVGGNYATDYVQTGRSMAESDQNRTAASCPTGANVPTLPNASSTSFLVRPMGPHVTPVPVPNHHHQQQSQQQVQQQPLGQHQQHPSVHVPNQAVEVFDNTVSACPVVASR